MSAARRGSSGPGDGPDRTVPGVGGADRAAPTAAPDAVEGTSAVERVGEVRAAEVEAVRGVEAARGPAALDAVGEVAAALRAGEMTIEDAVDRLIDDAVTRQVGRAIEPGSELEARLRRILRDYAEADPLISAKLRRLEARRGARRAR